MTYYYPLKYVPNTIPEGLSPYTIGMNDSV